MPGHTFCARVLALFLLCTVPLLPGCGSSSTTCSVNGKTYNNGESFPAASGCDSCRCEAGQVKCTLKACVDKTCRYDGKTYKEGSTFSATDGCNTCECTPNGLKCTEKDCTACEKDGTTYKSGDSFPAGDNCNTCTCNNRVINCTQKSCTPDQCNYDGKTYNSGDTFQHNDKCQSCNCNNGNVTCDSKVCSTCNYEGNTHKHGTSFPAVDGCNTCSCDDGKVRCTVNTCQEKSCNHENKEYKHGESYDASDGCNKCTCNDGSFQCTNKICACGISNGITCKSDEYCAYPDGSCNAAQGGSCKAKPTGGCPKNIDPTCGCDGKDYNNPCLANAAGVSVRAKGACKDLTCTYAGLTYKGGESFTAADKCNTCVCDFGVVRCTKLSCSPASCDSKTKCKAGMFCETPLGSCSGTGSCKAIPKDCPSNIAKICGCDGTTYANTCTAQAAGTSVNTTGKCP